jgi:hypothetical protein
MWCTLDAGDVPDDSPNLHYDDALGWLHRNTRNWHTLTGEFAHAFSWVPSAAGPAPAPSFPVSPLLPILPPPDHR